MNATFSHSAVKKIVLAFALVTFVGIQQTAMAGTGSGVGSSRPSASEAVRGALDNARHRYNQTLDNYGLTELYYGETSQGVCALKLDMPGRVEPLSILYERAYNTIQYSQEIPKGLAQQLINDRMLIDSYQRVLRADEANKNRLTPEQAREGREFRKSNPELGLAHAMIDARKKDREQKWKDRADSASEEEIRSALRGPCAEEDAKMFMELRQRSKMAGRGLTEYGLNENEKKDYEAMRKRIGRSLTTPSHRRGSQSKKPSKPDFVVGSRESHMPDDDPELIKQVEAARKRLEEKSAPLDIYKKYKDVELPVKKTHGRVGN